MSGKGWKLGLVAGGFAGAIAIAVLAVLLGGNSAADPNASGGMQAFSDMLLFAGVLGVLALIPAGAALFLFRARRPAWVTLAIVVLLLAATGVAAIVLYVTSRTLTVHTLLGVVVLLTPLRMLAAPLLSLLFLVTGALAPFRGPRYAIFAAALVEAAVCLTAAFLWFSGPVPR
jgi:hypothetical protein